MMIDYFGANRESWLNLLSQTEFWLQIIVIILATVAAYFVRSAMKRSDVELIEENTPSKLQRISRKGLDRIQFPISMLMVTLVGKASLNHLELTTPLLNVATPLLL